MNLSFALYYSSCPLLKMYNGFNLSVADIGAGNIWTRMLQKSDKIKNLYAVEPSSNMLNKVKIMKKMVGIKMGFLQLQKIQIFFQTTLT